MRGRWRRFSGSEAVTSRPVDLPIRDYGLHHSDVALLGQSNRCRKSPGALRWHVSPGGAATDEGITTYAEDG